MYLADNKIIPTRKFEHDPNLQNNRNNTVAMLLVKNNIFDIPKQWYHNPELQSCPLTAYRTVAMMYAQNKQIPPQEWYYNPYIADYYEKTVQNYLIENNIEVPEQWKVIDKQIEMTDEIKQQLEKYCEENSIENQQIVINYPQYQKHGNNDTFASYLETNGIQVPKEFLYNPRYILLNTMTTAMKIAEKGKIPSKHWNHDPLLEDDVWKRTVAILLARKGVIPPQEWQHNSTIQDRQGYTVAMYLAKNKIYDIPKQWEHNPLLKNKQQQTVAMICAYQGITPPQQWNHDKDIKDNSGFTVQDYLQSNNIEVPEQWRTTYCGVENKRVIKQLSEFCRLSRTNKDIIINNPEWQDNRYKQTFAIYLAQNSIIPPKQFIHDPNIKGKYLFFNHNKTVRDCLQYHYLSIPNEWYDDEYKQGNEYKPDYVNNAIYGIIIDKPDNINPEQCYEEYTVAMIYAKQGIIPPKSWNHNPYIANYYEKTVQDYLIQNNIEVPDNWKIIQLNKETKQHLKTYCKQYNIDQQTIINNPGWQDNENKQTFAMYLMRRKIIPPKLFEHNLLIKDNDNWTVGMYLAYKGIIPPDQWMHDIDIKNDQNESIRSYLYKHNYFYSNNEFNKFIKLTINNIQYCVQIQVLDDICQICLEEGEQEFIKSICTHKICIDCFQEMIKINNCQYCPVCRQKQWYKTSEQSQ